MPFRRAYAPVLRALTCWLIAGWVGLAAGFATSANDTATNGTAADDHAAVREAFDKEVHPLLEKYCFVCHGGAGEKQAGLDLARFKGGEQAIEARDLWERIAKRLKQKEMPPKDSDKPNKEEREKLIAWVGSLPRDRDCNKLATDDNANFYRGYVSSRRLTRAEYNNSIRDLVGLDLKPGDNLPADGSGGEGFDTTGSSLFTSPIHLEKYLQAARSVIEKVVPDAAEGLPPEVAAARGRILFVAPSDKLPPRAAAKQIVARFAQQAFRRPVEDAEVERFVTLFDRAEKRGDSFVKAVRLPLEAVLISPNFLFLVEPQPEQEGVYELAGTQLAQRLAYFLWSAPPDDVLLKLAAEDKLRDPEILKAQVSRMLADGRSRALAENFGVQWLGISTLGTGNRPDAGRFPEFDDKLASAMRAETVLTFDAVVRENRSLLELIDADSTFLDARLAALYGVQGVEGDAMRRVKLPDHKRGGVITQASVLTVTSYPLRTSPVLRGKWILEQLLGSPVPPPPPNAGVLPPDDKQADGLSLRERLEQHRARPECASCHQKMDPLGFGLQNFDAMGRWRTDDAGKPVDASGQLPSGEKFAGPAELKALLLARKHEFIEHLTRKMLGYALGRELNRFDRCVVDDTVKALEASDLKSHVLIEQVVLSYPFRHRFAKK